MFRILSLALVLVAGSWVLPAAAADYESKELVDAGTQYKQDLLDKVPEAKRKPNLIPRLRQDAAAEYKAKRYDQAIDDLETAISYGADDPRNGRSFVRSAAARSETLWLDRGDLFLVGSPTAILRLSHDGRGRLSASNPSR